MKFFLHTAVLIVAVCTASQAADLKIRVTGDRQPLKDVSLVFTELKTNLMTDDRGMAFIKNIPDGNYTVFAVLPGYDRYSNVIEIKGKDREISIRLNQTAYSLGEISVESKRNRGKASTETTIKPEQLEANTQTFMNDALKTLQLMPGVSSSGTSFDSSMYIQGGGQTEWISYMDGIFIENPVRWGGNLSMFNPYLIDSIDLYTAGYPAVYGQGLSGILVVNTRNGSKDRLKGFIDLSAISAEMLIEGPLASNLTVLFDMRRTYYDFIAPYFTPEDRRAGIEYPYLWDSLLKFDWDISPNDNLTFDAYGSLEGMKWNMSGDPNGPEKAGNLTGRYVYQIINLIGSTKYTHRFDPEDSFDISFGATPVFTTEQFSQSQSYSNNIDLNEYLYQLNSDFYLNSINGHKIQLGFSIIYIDPFYGDSYNSAYMLDNQGNWTNYYNKDVKYNYISAVSYSGSVMDDWEILPSFILELGGREEYYSLNNEYIFDPMAGIKWEATKELDFFARGGRYSQFPLDMTEVDSNTGNPNLQSQKVYHLIAGMDYSDNLYCFKTEGFYKHYYDLDENDSMLNINNSGTRDVYGADLYLQKKARKGDWFSGWLAYTYVYGLEEITSRSAENPSNPYTTPLDTWFVPDFLSAHTISALAEFTYYRDPVKQSFFDFLDEWKLSLQLTAMSGKPYTPVTNYISAPVNGGTQYYFSNGPYDSQYAPWYVRLDVKLTIPLGLDFLKGVLGPDVRGYLYVEVLNVLNYYNVISYAYTVNNGQLQKVAVTDWPIMPLGGIRIEF